MNKHLMGKKKSNQTLKSKTFKEGLEIIETIFQQRIS